MTASPAAQAGAPAFEVTKTADEAEVDVGDPIEFTMLVRNSGQGTATNVRLIDRLPVGTSWSFDHPGCFITAEGWLVCELGDMAAGDTETVRLTADSTMAMCGKVSNRAAAYADNHPKKQASNTAVVEVNCEQTPGLSVVKLPDSAQVNAGESIGFTITVRNNGPGTATDVELTDQLFAGIGWSENSADCEIDAANLLTCSFGDLAAGQQASVYVSAATTNEMCMELENTVTATASNISGEVTATAVVDILCSPDLIVDKVAEEALVSPGDTIRFTLQVTSAGVGPVENAELEDQLPSAPGLNWTVESVTGGGSCGITGNLLSCSFGTLTPGSARTVVVASPTTEESCGVLDNTATVTATNEDESAQGNNSDSDSITVNCASLAIIKTPDLDEVEAGDPIGFTITVANDGETTVSGVTLEDQLSPLTTWTEDSDACTISAGGLLTCDFGDLAPGASAGVHVTALSNEEMCGVLDNTATAAAENPAGEVSDDASINILCLPHLMIRKIAEEPDIPFGDVARFNIEVTNIGAAPAENVTVTDTLPVGPGLNWTFDNVVGDGMCEINAGVLSCSFGTLDPGEVVGVRISSPTTENSCGRIINKAIAAATNDPREVSDIDEIIVTCGADVTVTKEAEAPEIEAGTTARFTITVISHGTEMAEGVTLMDELPVHAGVEWTIESVTGGGTCSLNAAGDEMACEFGDMPTDTERTIVISSPTPVPNFCPFPGANPGGTVLFNYVTVQATNEAPLNVFDNAADAQTLVTCPSGPPPPPECQPLTYTNDFNGLEMSPAGWTNYRRDVTPTGEHEFLGRYSTSEEVIFEFTNPEPEVCQYNYIRVEFTLFVIQSWDGNNERISPRDPVVGPDPWRFGLLNMDGTRNWVADTTFTNYDFGNLYPHFRQSYPLPFPLGDYVAYTGTREFETLGYEFDGPQDGTYDMEFWVPITEQTVQLIWMAENLQGLGDESWGIDDLTVEMLSIGQIIEELELYWFPIIRR